MPERIYTADLYETSGGCWPTEVREEEGLVIHRTSVYPTEAEAVAEAARRLGSLPHNRVSLARGPRSDN